MHVQQQQHELKENSKETAPQFNQHALSKAFSPKTLDVVRLFLLFFKSCTFIFDYSSSMKQKNLRGFYKSSSKSNIS